MHRTPHHPPRPDRIDQVRECIARLETGWNHKNAYLWASAFTEPCEYIDAFGHYHRHWTHALNAQLHERSWSTVYSRSHARFLIESIEFPEEHLCMVILRCIVEYTTQEDVEKTLETMITAAIVKDGQEWFIRYFQNTPVRQ